MRFVNKLTKLFLVVAMFASFLGATKAIAQTTMYTDIGTQLNHAAETQGAGYGKPTDPRIIVVTIIRVLLTLIGTVLFVLIFYAGFLWMTAAGNSEQVEKATGIIKSAVIGLIIVLSSYTITIAASNISRGLPVSYGTGWGHYISSWIQ